MLRRLLGRTASRTAVAAALVAFGLSAPGVAQAAGDYAMNGTYTAQSNGQWAKTNERFEQRPAIISTWTIESACSNATDCTGMMTSNLGWSANIYSRSGVWYVKHVVPDWVKCPDGTAYDALQVFRFWPARDDGTVNPRETNYFIGEDKTTGPSGACGKNQWLVINMPFKLRKVT